MNKRELVEVVARYMDGDTAPRLSKDRVSFVLDAMTAEVIRELMSPGAKASYWPLIGKFVATWDEARVYLNQKTYQCVGIPARYRLRFRESRKLRDAVN